MTSAIPRPEWSPNKTTRRGRVSWLCVHWSAGSFASTVDWIMREVSEVSYHVVIAPDGSTRQAVPWSMASWAVGVAKSPDPRIIWDDNSNHSSESIALAGGPIVLPTPQQVARLLDELVDRMNAHRWGADQVFRILGHDQVATFPVGHPKQGQYGRKSDPQGWTSPNPQSHHWLPLDPIRRAVAARLV